MSESAAARKLLNRNSIYNEDLLESLICSGCGHYMVTPIEQCKKGHSICKFCRRQMARCPLCSGRYSGIRNTLAEDMASKMLFPCVHAEAGCERKVPNDEIEFHEPRCPFRLYRCLISPRSGEACRWEGRLVHLEDHVRRDHARYFSAQETTRWKWTPNLLVPMHDYQLLAAHGHLFWYCAVQEPERMRVMWFLQHVGFDVDSPRFDFRFEFESDEKDRHLVFTCRASPDYTPVASVVESGHCVDMSYQQALSFVDEEGFLKFTATVFKIADAADEDATGEDPANINFASDDPDRQDFASQDPADQDFASQDPVDTDFASQDLADKDFTTEDLADEDAAYRDATDEDIADTVSLSTSVAASDAPSIATSLP